MTPAPTGQRTARIRDPFPTVPRRSGRVGAHLALTITDSADPDPLACLIIAIFDGLQVQFLPDPEDADIVTPLKMFIELVVARPDEHISKQ
jgi:hypothetical protein